MKFCLPALRFIMGCNEGENESFLAITGFVIRAESLVFQRTTTLCGCPPNFLVVRMPLLRAAPAKPNPGKSDIMPSTDYFSVWISLAPILLSTCDEHLSV